MSRRTKNSIGYQVFTVLFTAFLMLPMRLVAHDSRPVFVEITERNPHHYQVQWKVPVSMPVNVLPRVVMPESCESVEDFPLRRVDDAYSFRETFECFGELAGSAVHIRYPNNNPGLSTLIRVRLLNGVKYTHILKPGESRWLWPAGEDAVDVAVDYTLFGIKHIFSGIDHLLFVACLLFIAATPRRILVTIFGFTVAHSLTLGLSALDLVRLPIPPVEAAIALSIVFLAHEIAVGNKNSWTWRFPLAVSVSFGFLHGFGFASVLRDIGLPQTELALGLLCFNIGVEIGQVMFITTVLMVIGVVGKLASLERTELLERRRTIGLCSYLIGGTASYWLVERIAGFTV